MGRSGVVVASATCKQFIAVRVTGWAVPCMHGVVLLGKALCPYVDFPDRGVSGYVVGPRRLCVCNKLRAPKLMTATLYAPRGDDMAYE